ncbi:hypothetical protein FOL47_001912, partial [Perkinsus chesapeaki]
MHGTVILFCVLITEARSKALGWFRHPKSETVEMDELLTEGYKQRYDLEVEDSSVTETDVFGTTYCELTTQPNMGLFGHLYEGKMVIDKLTCPPTEYGQQNAGKDYFPETLNSNPQECELFSIRTLMLSVRSTKNCTSAFLEMARVHSTDSSPTSSELIDGFFDHERIPGVTSPAVPTASLSRLNRELCADIEEKHEMKIKIEKSTYLVYPESWRFSEVIDNFNERLRCILSPVDLRPVRFTRGSQTAAASRKPAEMIQITGDKYEIKINVKKGELWEEKSNTIGLAKIKQALQAKLHDGSLWHGGHLCSNLTPELPVFKSCMYCMTMRSVAQCGQQMREWCYRTLWLEATPRHMPPRV